MGLMDILIIIVILLVCYEGYERGFFKQLYDFIIFLLVSLSSCIISDILYGFLYKSFPFLNLVGKAEGLKSINIILWKLVLFFLCIVILFYFIKKILIKIKLDQKIIDISVESNFIMKVLGVLMSIPLAIILLFDSILILMGPNLNLKFIRKSNFAEKIMTQTPVLANMNNNLYENECWIIDRINKKDNTIENYAEVNDSIIKHISETKLLSKEQIEELKSLDKLLGTRKKKEEKNNSDSNYNNSSNTGGNNNESPDDYYDEESESYSEEYEEDFEDEDTGGEMDEEGELDDFCSDFPEDC